MHRNGVIFVGDHFLLYYQVKRKSFGEILSLFFCSALAPNILTLQPLQTRMTLQSDLSGGPRYSVTLAYAYNTHKNSLLFSFYSPLGFFFLGSLFLPINILLSWEFTLKWLMFKKGRTAWSANTAGIGQEAVSEKFSH